MNKDSQLIFEAYNDMPPQCPPHLLEEGLSHQLHAWVFGKALPWLQANKGKVAAAGGVAAALAAFMGMDPDTAQQVVDGMDPETLQGLEGSTETVTSGQMTIDLPNNQVLFKGQPATDDQILDYIERLEQTKATLEQSISNAGDSLSDRSSDLKSNRIQQIDRQIKDLESFIGITDSPQQVNTSASVASPKPQVNPSDF